ncbi:MAG: Hsp20/alpha crystallin family protein [Deltaproteobacteria bacterium]|jgi:HSP20 family protein|nr:Hsp20/alpha crystallin family protein [Deltaproteobacteria bacterium]
MVIDFSSMHEGSNEIERIFEDMFKKGPLGSRRLFPQVNVFENDDGYIVDFCVPGIPIDDIELVLTARNLIIKGERKSPEGRYFRQERLAGSFQRALSLNVPVDLDRVNAKNENGILRVTLPKAELVRPRKINIHSRSGN